MRRTSLMTFAAAAMVVAVGEAKQTPHGSVAGEIVIDKDGSAKSDRSRVVVYLEDVPETAAAPSAKKQIRQKDIQFDPALTVVTTGTTVEFPNEDKIAHNVFSISEPAKFDLGLYKSGTSKAVTFKHPGVVDIYCNIHPQMIAKLVVVESGFYQVTAADGKFRIDGIPPGEYPIVAWQANGEAYHGKVTIKAGGVSNVSIKLVEGAAQKAHLRKDGTPYGRYQ